MNQELDWSILGQEMKLRELDKQCLASLPMHLLQLLKKTQPGFEAIFDLGGLLVIVFVVLGRKQ